MKSNYSSWTTIILFLHFKFHFLLLFTALEQELYCCAKSAKKITLDRLRHSSLKKQTGKTPLSGESWPSRTCASASIRRGGGRGQRSLWPFDPREHRCLFSSWVGAMWLVFTPGPPRGGPQAWSWGTGWCLARDQYCRLPGLEVHVCSSCHPVPPILSEGDSL